VCAFPLIQWQQDQFVPGAPGTYGEDEQSGYFRGRRGENIPLYVNGKRKNYWPSIYAEGATNAGERSHTWQK
jgi:hypothetical protein